MQFWMFLVSEDQIEHLRRNKNVLNLQTLCITKLKALFIKSLSNPSVSSGVPTVWTYNCSLTQLFWKFCGKFHEKHQWRSSNKHPWRLLNFETERFLLEKGLYSKVSETNNIINIKTLFFCFQNKNET